MSEIQKFPFHKKDNLGRVIYTKWNDRNRTIKKYWGTTQNIKIIYKFYGEDIAVSAFDEKGVVRISYSGDEFNIAFKNIVVNDKEFFVKIKRKFVNHWKKLLNTNEQIQ